MAAVVRGCRRAVWPLTTYRTAFSTRVEAVKLPVFPVHSCTACFRRWQTTTAMGEEAGDTKEETWLEKAKKRSWLWRWLNDVDEIERNSMSEEEYQERESLIQKMTDLYFDDPKKKWDVTLYREIFDLLIKYNDSGNPVHSGSPHAIILSEVVDMPSSIIGESSAKTTVGVEIFYGMMKEMQVEADDELIEKVESYRVKAKEESWFE